MERNQDQLLGLILDKLTELTKEIALQSVREEFKEFVNLEQMNAITGMSPKTLARFKKAGLKTLNSGTKTELFLVSEIKRFMLSDTPLPGGRSKFKKKPSSKIV